MLRPYGILFFAAWARRIGEHFPIPFLVVPGRRVCAVGKIGEAILGGNTAPRRPQKALSRLDQESIVLILGESAVYRVLVDPDCLPEVRSEEHTSELQSQSNLVCRLL